MKTRKYQIGDMVLIDRRNLTIPKGTIRSLSDRWIGPYRIVQEKWDGHAYEVDIPTRTRIHEAYCMGNWPCSEFVRLWVM